MVKNGDNYPETEVDKHVAKLFLVDFQQSGIHLDNKSRESVVDLTDEILQLGQNFASNVHSPVVLNKNSVPSDIQHVFHQQGDRIIVAGYHIDSPTERAREAAFKIYYWNDPEKEQVLHTLLCKRHELAQVCSFDTFSQRAMLDSLAQDPFTVHSFLGITSDLKMGGGEGCKMLCLISALILLYFQLFLFRQIVTRFKAAFDKRL